MARIEWKKVLDNFTRAEIFNHICSNPGTSYSRARQELGKNHGTMLYHIKVLEDSGFIKTELIGRYRKLYPRHAEIGEHELRSTLSDGQSKILGEVEKTWKYPDGITTKEIKEATGFSYRKVCYSMSMLRKKMFVRMTNGGKAKKFHPNGNTH